MTSHTLSLMVEVLPVTPRPLQPTQEATSAFTALRAHRTQEKLELLNLLEMVQQQQENWRHFYLPDPFHSAIYTEHFYSISTLCFKMESLLSCQTEQGPLLLQSC